MRVRRSNEERIKELEAKIKKLKEQSIIEKEVKLTKESAGIAEAIAAIENAALINNISVAEIVKAISRLKRTGLKIENATPKSKSNQQAE